MDDARVGALFVLCSGAGFGTLGVLGVVAGDAELSIPTVLFLRFGLATVVVWVALGVRDQLRRLRGRNLPVGLALGAFGYAAMSGLYFVGLSRIGAGPAAILSAVEPVVTVLLGASF
jgi:drug/metabolite transporter (DMT)-like permease